MHSFLLPHLVLLLHNADLFQVDGQHNQRPDQQQRDPSIHRSALLFVDVGHLLREDVIVKHALELWGEVSQIDRAVACLSAVCRTGQSQSPSQKIGSGTRSPGAGPSYGGNAGRLPTRSPVLAAARDV